MSAPKLPEVLEKIVNTVLAYKPKSKTKAAKKRKKIAKKRKSSSSAPPPAQDAPERQ
jgi:hypothetical protein